MCVYCVNGEVGVYSVYSTIIKQNNWYNTGKAGTWRLLILCDWCWISYAPSVLVVTPPVWVKFYGSFISRTSYLVRLLFLAPGKKGRDTRPRVRRQTADWQMSEMSSWLCQRGGGNLIETAKAARCKHCSKV